MDDRFLKKFHVDPINQYHASSSDLLNIGIALAGGLSHSVAHGLVLPGLGMNHVLFLAVAGMVLFIITTLLVSTILCLLKSSSLQKVWHSVQT